jgi:hypothetical protein
MKSIRLCKYVLTISFAIGGLFAITDAQNHVYPIPNLPWETQQRRLDQTAAKLKSDSAAIAYLIGYNKEGTSPRTALSRLRKSKNYLVRHHLIAAERITTVYESTDPSGFAMLIWVVDSQNNYLPY